MVRVSHLVIIPKGKDPIVVSPQLIVNGWLVEHLILDDSKEFKFSALDLDLNDWVLGDKHLIVFEITSRTILGKELDSAKDYGFIQKNMVLTSKSFDFNGVLTLSFTNKDTK